MPRESRVRRTLNRAREKLGEIEDGTVNYIKNNPVKSVLIAAGVGALISFAIFKGIDYAAQEHARKRNFWNRINPFN